ncbi:uncharacterized protein [Littorina saxatilis]|uniref:Uncharacterized protein n=1 Tax=Littorina saxatilis TaxID=31220 RepID=A0AAN9G035_9CAEN
MMAERGVASWLLLMLATHLLFTASHGFCPTDFYGEGCKKKCRCVSPINSNECACASTNGQCDMLCMSGKYVLPRPTEHHVAAAVLGGGAVAFVIAALTLLVWNKHLLNKKGPLRRQHGRGCVDAQHHEPVDGPANQMLQYDVTLDHSKSKKLLAEMSSTSHVADMPRAASYGTMEASTSSVKSYATTFDSSVDVSQGTLMDGRLYLSRHSDPQTIDENPLENIDEEAQTSENQKPSPAAVTNIRTGEQEVGAAESKPADQATAETASGVPQPGNQNEVGNVTTSEGDRNNLAK